MLLLLEEVHLDWLQKGLTLATWTILLGSPIDYPTVLVGLHNTLNQDGA